MLLQVIVVLLSSVSFEKIDNEERLSNTVKRFILETINKFKLRLVIFLN